MYVNFHEVIGIVARPKIRGFGDHLGVACDGYVLDLRPEGIRLVPMESFAQGQEIRVLHSLDDGDRVKLWQRMLLYAGQPRPYRAVDSNCEHLAYEVATGVPRSPQAAGWVFVALIGMIYYCSAK